MKKYRIVKVKKYGNFSYRIEKRYLCFWLFISSSTVLERAENEIKELKQLDLKPKREIIGYY